MAPWRRDARVVSYAAVQGAAPKTRMTSASRGPPRRSEKPADEGKEALKFHYEQLGMPTDRQLGNVRASSTVRNPRPVRGLDGAARALHASEDDDEILSEDDDETLSEDDDGILSEDDEDMRVAGGGA